MKSFWDNTYYDRVWSKNCNEKRKEIRKDARRLIKVALAPLPIYRTWTNKSEEKTLRLEKEIGMLRQLLDNAIPEDADSYLTLVSKSLKDIEKVLLSKLDYSKVRRYKGIIDLSNHYHYGYMYFLTYLATSRWSKSCKLEKKDGLKPKKNRFMI